MQESVNVFGVCLKLYIRLIGNIQIFRFFTTSVTDLQLTFSSGGENSPILLRRNLIRFLVNSKFNKDQNCHGAELRTKLASIFQSATSKRKLQAASWLKR